ncbi:MAG TPA: adenylate/guanylate cyclase domain-containing protein [Gaiellaceae bacterium]|nr:adenylate/guanylate cyclase domain-containing protein [Gaiellaceae bacterium]
MIVCSACGEENPDRARFCLACGNPLAVAEAPREVRKVVTVLFADTVGSTALGESRDPEAVRAQMADWFAAARAVLERHGGRVEKFVGDAVMAVFGVPQANEDDALRAVRAAAELRSPQLRIGVNTGGVVTGEGETLVTGDAVNVAARLEQAAAPGEILIGAETRGLVRDAVEVERTDVVAKGKAEPVEAYRLIHLDPGAEGLARHPESPLVGRVRELDRLRRDFDTAVEDRTCHLFTLLGAAGVGKSRLVAEFLAGVDAAVVRGRCLHYGDGITYWPLVEVLVQLGDDPDHLLELPSPPEIALAARRRLEQRAADGPLVVVFDDLHWAEPTFLDLVEHVADFSREAPIFLLCVARPELLELRPAWGGGKVNATTVLLEPLPATDTETLIRNLLGAKEIDEETRQRILAASEGNPLFVEEMLAMLREDAAVAVPPTIHALLQARLDHLASDERAVIERGAVEGQVFHRGPVAVLAPGAVGETIDTHLAMLVRKEMIRPDKPAFPGDDAFRFRHLLIRDAAYESLPKETRADLHERFALWLDEHAVLVEQEEIVGYHLEQAVLYRRELGRDDAALASRAAERLTHAGRSALDRGDYTAGAKIFERAAALPPPGDPVRLRVLVDLADALAEAGRFDDARACLVEPIQQGDEVTRAHARLSDAFIAAYVGADFGDLRAAADRALPLFERAGDELGIARAYWMYAIVDWTALRAAEATAHMSEALEHAERAHARAFVSQIHSWLLGPITHGPMPVEEGEQALERLAESAGGGVMFGSALDRARARLAAMRGDVAEARRLTEAFRQVLADAGVTVGYASSTLIAAFVEEAAGDLPAAERAARGGIELLNELDERPYSSTLAAVLAHILLDQRRDEEALEWARYARERSPAGDLTNFISADAVEGCVLARRGEIEEGLRLVLDAAARVDRTDFWDQRSDVHSTLAEALLHAGRHAEARAELELALRICEEKGARPWAERLRQRLARLV